MQATTTRVTIEALPVERAIGPIDQALRAYANSNATIFPTADNDLRDDDYRPDAYGPEGAGLVWGALFSVAFWAFIGAIYMLVF